VKSKSYLVSQKSGLTLICERCTTHARQWTSEHGGKQRRRGYTVTMRVLRAVNCEKCGTVTRTASRFSVGSNCCLLSSHTCIQTAPSQ
jgi:hypothetical protein